MEPPRLSGLVGRWVEYHVHAFEAAESTYIMRVERSPKELRRGWIVQRDAPAWKRNDQFAYRVDPQTSNSDISIDRRYALALLRSWVGNLMR
jgi:hypothetical protein